MSARETALRVLIACRERGAWADAALNAQIGKDGLSGSDAALCSRLVYGVLQNQLLLDHVIGAYCTQKVAHLQPPLQDILRLGAYQILFLEKVPDRAAVNESVELAKQFRRAAAAGLVNAVLRKISQNRETLPPIPGRDEAAFLSIRYSHPKWIVKRLLAILGREETESFLASDNETAPVTVQVNPLHTSEGELLAAITEGGVQARPHPWVPGCLELKNPGNLTALPGFREGAFFVQDGAARLVPLVAGIRPGQRVLDVCAAPGGKTFAAAVSMEDRGEIVACDLHENKLKRLREGAARLGISCVTTRGADGRQFHDEWSQGFDVVLTDVPCSGLGIIRKKPDIRYKKPEDLFTLPVIQSEILDNAARYVRPGGVLVYSTCTILPEENEQVCAAFLAVHPEFSMDGFSLPGGRGGEDGQITLWPHRHETDGFYICRMVRHT